MVAPAVAVAVIFGSGEARAQRGPFGGRGDDVPGWVRHVETLDLSAAQVQKIAEARADMVVKTAPAKAQLQVKHYELRALWTSKAPERRAIVAKHDEIDALERQVRDARIDFKLRVIGVLTTAQRDRLQKSLEEAPFRGRGHGPGRGYGKGPGPGPGKGPGQGPGKGPGPGPDGPRAPQR
jgi:Spy/CpxP family protein refolding chaperone